MQEEVVLNTKRTVSCSSATCQLRTQTTWPVAAAFSTSLASVLFGLRSRRSISEVETTAPTNHSLFPNSTLGCSLTVSWSAKRTVCSSPPWLLHNISRRTYGIQLVLSSDGKTHRGREGNKMLFYGKPEEAAQLRSGQNAVPGQSGVCPHGSCLGCACVGLQCGLVPSG